MKKLPPSKYFSFYFSGFIIVGLVLAYFFLDSFQDFVDEAWDVLLSDDTERTRDYFSRFGLWGPLAIIIFIVLQMFLIVFPSWLPIIVAVMAYGFWWGVLISLLGVTIASTIGYYIGLKLKSTFLKKLLGEEKLEKMQFWISRYAFGSVVLFRISPFLSNDAISFIAGIFEMGYKKYMLATMAGMVPLALAVGYFSNDISKLENGLYWIGGAGIIAYGIYIYLDQKRKKQKDQA